MRVPSYGRATATFQEIEIGSDIGAFYMDLTRTRLKITFEADSQTSEIAERLRGHASSDGVQNDG